jgi:glutathionyl-hydroquinone reductase
MGMLVDGEWLANDERYRRSNDGAFVRPASAFRGFVTVDRSSGFPAEDRSALSISQQLAHVPATSFVAGDTIA